MTILVFIAVVLALVLGVAWYDGGRQEQRLIVEPVPVPGATS